MSNLNVHTPIERKKAAILVHFPSSTLLFRGFSLCCLCVPGTTGGRGPFILIGLRSWPQVRAADESRLECHRAARGDYQPWPLQPPTNRRPPANLTALSALARLQVKGLEYKLARRPCHWGSCHSPVSTLRFCVFMPFIIKTNHFYMNLENFKGFVYMLVMSLVMRSIWTDAEVRGQAVHRENKVYVSERHR